MVMVFMVMVMVLTPGFNSAYTGPLPSRAWGRALLLYTNYRLGANTYEQSFLWELECREDSCCTPHGYLSGRV